MGAFSNIELEWDGKVHLIKSHKVMGAISRIEDHITLAELQTYGNKQTAPLGKLCMAFASVLRYAGARVTDDEIYAKTFDGPEAQAAVMSAITNLMRMMLPASARARMEEAESSGEVLESIEDSDLGNSEATAPAS